MQLIEEAHIIVLNSCAQVEVKKVHILAHDMGNRALIEALQNFQKSDSSSLVKPSHSSNMQNIVQVDVKGVLENVIFLAPDAMRAKFEDMDLDNMCNSRRMQELPLFFTIYSSDHYRQLFLSWRLHEEKHLVNIQSLLQMNIREEDATPKRLIKVTQQFGVDLDMSPQHSYMDLDHKFLHDDIVGEIQNLLSSKQQAAVGIRINIINN
jgi:esterase/lipase superfamily enzyme